jgi:hypothetical protein
MPSNPKAGVAEQIRADLALLKIGKEDAVDAACQLNSQSYHRRWPLRTTPNARAPKEAV